MKKKVNPRRIPMAKKELDREAITTEATTDQLSHAWILIANALVEQEYATPDEVVALSDEVNDYVAKNPMHGDKLKAALSRADALMGKTFVHPYLDPRAVHSAVELENFKKKVHQVAYHAAQCSICLGLHSTGKFTQEQLQRLFLDADLTEAEINAGHDSYEAIEARIEEKIAPIISA